MLSFDNTENAFSYKSNKELRKAYWLFRSMKYPQITNIGTNLTLFAYKNHLPVNGIMYHTLFKQFCGGRNLEEAYQTSLRLMKYGVDVILDYGVEAKEEEVEFDHAKSEFIKAIRFAANKESIPFISVKLTGLVKFSLLEKINKRESLNLDEDAEWKRAKSRLNDIVEEAVKGNVKVLIDAEESWIQYPIDEVADEMMARYNKDKVWVYNTFQMYRHDMLESLILSLRQAKNKNYLLGAKLVRGAYMEKERERASEMGYPSPIQVDKASTDRDYNEGILHVIKDIQQAELFVGTHNEESCLKTVELMDAFGVPISKVYFSQLYGMSDNISFNLAHEGFQVLKYLPYGPVHDVVPYLLRRARENTSVEGQSGRELTLISKEIARRKTLN